jgi:L-fuconolactonase
MPNFPIVDTHLHIWDLGRLRYPWLGGVPMLNRNHLIEDYRRACGPVQVAKMVFLQCECDFAQYQAEADWVTEVARVDPRIRGIVPWAPLEKGGGRRRAGAARRQPADQGHPPHYPV